MSTGPMHRGDSILTKGHCSGIDLRSSREDSWVVQVPLELEGLLFA